MAIMAAIAAIGTAATVASVGYSLSGAGQPTQPNLAASSAEMAQTEARLLPYLRAVEAAAEEGGQALKQGFTTTTNGDQLRAKLEQQLQQAQQQLQAGQGGTVEGIAGRQSGPGQKLNPEAIQGLQARISNLQGQIAAIPAGSGAKVYLDRNGNVVPASKAFADFSGYSQADIEGTIAKQLAQGELTNAQQFDSQFIESALAQEAQADPQGTAARKTMYDLIQQQINNPPKSPVSEEMQNQVMEKVAAGNNLTPEEEQLFKTALAAVGDRGGGNVPADFSRDLTTGFAGEQRSLDNADEGTKWLSSGETPQDIQYRSEQQNLANLSNFLQGRTPQSEFSELSGAQAGPTPMAGNPNLSTLNPNAGQQGANAAVNTYGLNVDAALNQPNSWMQGLSSLLGAANVAGAAGWKPFAQQPQYP